MKQFDSITSVLRRSLRGLGVLSLMCFLGAGQPGKAPVRPVRVPAPAASPIKAAAAPAVVNLLHVLHEDPAPQTRVVRMEVTAYCPCKKCCGPNAVGLTASGLHVSHNGGRFVAADTDVLPFGTKVMIPGYDLSPVPVIDRGGAIKGKKLDVFYPTHEEALEWGRRMVDVTVVEQ